MHQLVLLLLLIFPGIAVAGVVRDDSGFLCQPCEQFVKALEDQLEDHEGDITANNLCKRAYGDGDKFDVVCEMIVDTAINEVIEDIMETVSPLKVCEKINLCTPLSSVTPTTKA